VHEVLMERRDDDVDLGELVERLRAMLVQGLASDKAVHASLEPVLLAGQQATAVALVFSELFQNALEHGGRRVRVELTERGQDIRLVVEDDGGALAAEPEAGTGLSIVRALVQDELRGTLELGLESGLRAEVVFPAWSE